MNYKSIMKNGKTHIFLLYLVLIAGGLWHLLGWFQILMYHLASPLLITLAIILYVDLHKSNIPWYKTTVWSTIVLFAGFAIETIGVKTGLVFGHYSYGEVLIPQIFGVPVVIGFAWLGVSISAAGTAIYIIGEDKNIFPPVFLAVGLMVFFDVLMEPAAGILGYWAWKDDLVPMKNYLAWFIISFIFIYLGFKWNLFKKQLSQFSIHAFIAQCLYFLLINLKKLLL